MDASQLPKLDRFSLHVTVYFKPEDVPKFWEAFKPCFEAIAPEKECLYFEVFEDPAEPGKISWVENWDCSTDWWINVSLPFPYRRSPLLELDGKLSMQQERFPKRMDVYKPYFDATEPLFSKPREFKILKRVGAPYVVQKPDNVK